MTATLAGAVDDPRKAVVFALGPGLVRVRAPNPSVMTATGTNSYLVGTSDLVAIDPGPDDPSHVEQLLALAAGRLRYVLVTHSHRDHAPGARMLADATGVPLLGFGSAALVPDGALHDGDVVAIPGFRIEAVHTPGHASDHLCFLADREEANSAERICFTGDHVMGGSTVVIMPPDGSMAAYLESLERLRELERPITTIAPGHGEAITDPERVLRRYLEHRRERERLVLEALTDESRSPLELVPEVYRALDPRLAVAAAGSLWAHLRKLGDDGLAWCCDDVDDREGRWRRVSATGD